MTDRAHSLTVVLDHDVRVDDLKEWIQAIRMMRSVIAVKANVRDAHEFVAEQRVRSDLSKRLWKALEEK